MKKPIKDRKKKKCWMKQLLYISPGPAVYEKGVFPPTQCVVLDTWSELLVI